PAEVATPAPPPPRPPHRSNGRCLSRPRRLSPASWSVRDRRSRNRPRLLPALGAAVDDLGALADRLVQEVAPVSLRPRSSSRGCRAATAMLIRSQAPAVLRLGVERGPRGIAAQRGRACGGGGAGVATSAGVSARTECAWDASNA